MSKMNQYKQSILSKWPQMPVAAWDEICLCVDTIEKDVIVENMGGMDAVRKIFEKFVDETVEARAQRIRKDIYSEYSYLNDCIYRIESAIRDVRAEQKK